MRISLLKFAATCLFSTLLLSACSEELTIFPDSVELNLYPDSQIIDDCDVSQILETAGNNIVCVSFPFPSTLTDADAKRDFAVDVSRHYADELISKNWTTTTKFPLVYNFEKEISDECSNAVQLLAWVVDENKPVEKRHFPTSRITFVEKQNPICGDKRKAK